MSNVRKRDGITFYKDSSYSGAEGNDYQQRGAARRGFYAREQLEKQRARDQQILDEFANRSGKATKEPESLRAPQPRDGIRLDAPSQSPTFISEDKIDLSSISRNGPNSSSGSSTLPRPNGSRKSHVPPPPTATRPPAGRGFAVQTGTSQPDTMASLRNIHESSRNYSLMSREKATIARLERIYSGIPSWSDYYVAQSNFSVASGTNFSAASEKRRINLSDFKLESTEQVNPPNNNDLSVWKQGYLGAYNPFGYDGVNYRLIDYYPVGFVYPGQGTPNVSGHYLVDFSATIKSSTAQEYILSIEEDDSGVALAEQPALRTYFVQKIYVDTFARQFHASFVWRNRGDSVGLRFIGISVSAAADLTLSCPKLRLHKIDE